MDLRVKDSKIIKSIVHEAFYDVLGNESENIISAFNLDDAKTSDLLSYINEILTRLNLRSETKRKLIEKISENLNNYVSVAFSPDRVELIGSTPIDLNVTVGNMFDLPIIFNVYLEDRDNFLQVIYDKNNDSYVNTYYLERIIDSGDKSNFKFKLLNTKNYNKKDSTLFIIVRSADLNLLNVINKLPLHISL